MLFACVDPFYDELRCFSTGKSFPKEKKMENIKILNLQMLYACHCTGENAQNILKKHTPLIQAGSGLVIEI